MRKREGGRHAKYDRIDYGPYQPGAQHGCPSAGSCGCSECRPGGHTGVMTHCWEHGSGCHLLCTE